MSYLYNDHPTSDIDPGTFLLETTNTRIGLLPSQCCSGCGCLLWDWIGLGRPGEMFPGGWGTPRALMRRYTPRVLQSAHLAIRCAHRFGCDAPSLPSHWPQFADLAIPKQSARRLTVGTFSRGFFPTSTFRTCNFLQTPPPQIVESINEKTRSNPNRIAKN